jgi:hypothetical protein
VFENRLLRKIFEPKRDEITGKWTRLQNNELYGLYSSPRVIKSRKMRWAGMCHIGTYRVLVGHLGKRDYLEDLDVDWRIILKWIFKKWEGKAGLDLRGSRLGQVVGPCKYGNEICVE